MPPKRTGVAKSVQASKPKANTKAKLTKPKKVSNSPQATSTKRKAVDDAPVPPAKKAKPTAAAAPKKVAAPKKIAAPKRTVKAVPEKKAKLAQKGPVINAPPTDRLHVYVFGEGTAGELGLGTAKNAVDVKRPRLNPHLAADTVGVVQIAAGGMHVVALTHDNQILTWGVNDAGALGRDTQWEGGLKDMDAAGDEEEDSDDDENDNGLNPRESVPGAVDFSDAELPEGTRFVQVAAGDSCSFALTDDGHVYGWGEFRGNEGSFGFTPTAKTAFRPVLIPDLKKITSVKAGANHALALDTNGAVFSWGSGQQNQLGRRMVERKKEEGLRPREFGLPKGPRKGIKTIESGAYHSFAISKSGDVYGWGLNNFGETGIMDNAGQDDAVIKTPQIVTALEGLGVVAIKGGGHHSLASTEQGACLAWGRIDGHQVGITDEQIHGLPDDAYIKDSKGEPRVLCLPQRITTVTGEVTAIATNSDHAIVVTREGKAWSWGFSANYQTGQGQVDDVLLPTMIDNTAVRERKLVGAETGGQFSILTAVA